MERPITCGEYKKKYLLIDQYYMKNVKIQMGWSCLQRASFLIIVYHTYHFLQDIDNWTKYY